jgi:hypothetical protein
VRRFRHGKLNKSPRNVRTRQHLWRQIKKKRFTDLGWKKTHSKHGILTDEEGGEKEKKISIDFTQ